MKGAQGNFDWYEKSSNEPFQSKPCWKRMKQGKFPVQTKHIHLLNCLLSEVIRLSCCQRKWMSIKVKDGDMRKNNISSTGNGNGRKMFSFFYDELPPCWRFLASSVSSKIIPQMFFIMCSVSDGWIFVSAFPFHFYLCTLFCIEGLYFAFERVKQTGDTHRSSESTVNIVDRCWKSVASKLHSRGEHWSARRNVRMRTHMCFKCKYSGLPTVE